MLAVGDVEGLATPVLYSSSYRATVLGLLVVAYAFNLIDRAIVSIVGQAIKVDLKLTDTQLGLLGGFAFALLYTSLGIPVARLAERWNRVNIIAIAIVVWSGFTAACGAAQNFLQLLLLRVGVGVGEAGLSPPAHSLISDYYEPPKRASALAIYSAGIPLGALVGGVAGGWLTQTFSWRAAFVAVGLPGVLIALAIKLVIKELPRGHSEPPLKPVCEAVAGVAPTSNPAAPPKHRLRTELQELRIVVATLFGKRPVLHMVLGITIASFASSGVAAFNAPFFLRTFALDYTQVGLITGVVTGVSAGIGTLLGGFLTDRLARRSARWYALVPAIGLTLAGPMYISAYLQPTWQLVAAILFIPGIFHFTYLGPTFGVVQNMVDTRRRATASAVLLFFLNLIALGGGPVFTGWLIDLRGHHHFGLLGDFSLLCPGGVAPADASAALVSQCKAALIKATREGIVLTCVLYLWSGAHYLAASFGLVKALGDARAARGEAA